MIRHALAFVVSLAGLSGAISFAADIPYLTGRVVDDADILSAGARARLMAALKAHEEATSDQIVVLTVTSIGPESIEAYAVEVVRSWKIGQKGKDSSVLVVVVPQDRKMRIEVGYGLEESDHCATRRLSCRVSTRQALSAAYSVVSEGPDESEGEGRG